MEFDKFIGFFVILIIIIFSGCSQEVKDGEEDGAVVNIVPVQVETISGEDISIFEFDETQCLSGEKAVPKIGFTWKWGEIDEAFCQEKVLDETQFSICLLKQINNNFDAVFSKKAVFCGDNVCNEESLSCESDCKVESAVLTANYMVDFDGKTSDIFLMNSISLSGVSETGRVVISFFEKTNLESYLEGDKLTVTSAIKHFPPKEMRIRVSSIQKISSVEKGVVVNDFFVTLDLIDVSEGEEILETQVLQSGNKTNFNGKIMEIIKLESIGVSASTDEFEVQIGAYKNYDKITFLEKDSFFAQGEKKIRKNYTIKIKSISSIGPNKFAANLELFEMPSEISTSGIEFYANLMPLSFSDDFRADFHEYYTQKNFLDTPSFYTENDGLGELFSSTEKFVFNPKELKKPGKYQIIVTGTLEPEKTINVNFYQVDSDEFVSNAFYYLNFNGLIGITDNGADRQGYGLGYQSINEKINLSDSFFIDSSDIGSGKFDIDIEKITRHKSLNLTLGKRDTAIKVVTDLAGGNGKLQVSHAIATPLLLHAKVNDLTNIKKLGILYNIFTPQGQEFFKGDSLLLWQPIGKSCVDFSGSNKWLYDAFNEGDPPAYMLYYDLSSLFPQQRTSGDIYLKTIVYSTELLSISPLGITKNNILKKDDLEFKTPFGETGVKSDISLSGTPKSKFNSPENITSNFEQIFELVKEGLMCVQKKGNQKELETTIKWNEPKLFEFIGTQLETATNNCTTICLSNEVEENNTFPTANFNPINECSPSTIKGSIKFAEMNGKKDTDIINLGEIFAGDVITTSYIEENGRLDVFLFNENNELIEPYYRGIFASPETVNNIFVAGESRYTKKEFNYELNLEKEFDLSPEEYKAILHVPEKQFVLLNFDGANGVVISEVSMNVPVFDPKDIHQSYAGNRDEMIKIILSEMKKDFEGYNVEFFTSKEDIPEGFPYSTVHFGGSDKGQFGNYAFLFGIAQSADYHNIFKDDEAIVFTENFPVIPYLFPNKKKLSRWIAGAGSHELGHLLGLLHTEDSLGIMNSGASLDSILNYVLLDSFSFRVSPIHKDIFPIGKQNARKTLELTVGIGE